MSEVRITLSTGAALVIESHSEIKKLSLALDIPGLTKTNIITLEFDEASDLSAGIDQPLDEVVMGGT